jgi:hypothetical protein
VQPIMGIYSIRTARNDRSTAGGPLETAWLRLVNTPIGQELNSLEVDFTSAENLRIDVPSKDHQGDS